MTRWHEVHAGFLRCSSIRSRTDRTLPSFEPPVSSSAGTLGGGGGGGEPSMTCITHLPRCTGEVRSATEVIIRMLPWVRMPRRVGGSGTRRNSVPVTLGIAVVPGQPLVHEGVVGVEQVEHAAVLAHQAGEEQLGLRAASTRSATDPTADRGCRRAAPSRRPAAAATAIRSAWPGPRPWGRRACGAPGGRAPAVVLSVPAVATFTSSASGTVPQMKNDRREASSRSVMR